MCCRTTGRNRPATRRTSSSIRHTGRRSAISCASASFTWSAMSPERLKALRFQDGGIWLINCGGGQNDESSKSRSHANVTVSGEGLEPGDRAVGGPPSSLLLDGNALLTDIELNPAWLFAVLVKLIAQDRSSDDQAAEKHVKEISAHWPVVPLIGATNTRCSRTPRRASA